MGLMLFTSYLPRQALAKNFGQSVEAFKFVPRHAARVPFAAEWRRVLSLGAFLMLVVGPLVYGVFYPQHYLNLILRKIPSAVVTTT